MSKRNSIAFYQDGGTQLGKWIADIPVWDGLRVPVKGELVTIMQQGQRGYSDWVVSDVRQVFDFYSEAGDTIAVVVCRTAVRPGE